MSKMPDQNFFKLAIVSCSTEEDEISKFSLITNSVKNEGVNGIINLSRYTIRCVVSDKYKNLISATDLLKPMTLALQDGIIRSGGALPQQIEQALPIVQHVYKAGYDFIAARLMDSQ